MMVFMFHSMNILYLMGELPSDSKTRFLNIFSLRRFNHLQKFIQVLDYKIRAAFNAIKNNNI
jgi:hypothetical protein